MKEQADHSKRPIIDMLNESLKREQTSFHIPGHNKASGFDAEFKNNPLAFDTTEFDLTDDLNMPGQAVEKAQELLALAYGAGKSFMVTTGASLAIHAAILALAARGEIILADRMSHSSLFNACRLFGIKIITAMQADLPKTIEEHPDAAAIFVTRPDYYGLAAPINEIVDMAQKHRIPLLADEAHGSHFAFADHLMPKGGLACGCDLVVHSAHKTLPALTQSALIHISKDFLRTNPELEENLQNALRAVTTTSPSFLIAASIDYARSRMILRGREQADELNSIIDDFLNSLPLNLSGAVRRGGPGKNINRDPFRLIISPGKTDIDKDLLLLALTEKGIYPEFSDLTDIVLVAKATNTSQDFRLLGEAMKTAYDKSHQDPEKLKNYRKKHRLNLHVKNLILQVHQHAAGHLLDPAAFPFSDSRALLLALENSRGKKVCEPCNIYPPGIPLLLPGQLMDDFLIKKLLEISNYGIDIDGLVKKGETLYLKVR